MKQRKKSIPNGAALIVVMLMALLLSIIATTFVNFQVIERKMSQNEVNDLKAFMMADSGISYALCHICRDSEWQGNGSATSPVTRYQWVCEEGAYLYGFRVDSYFNAYDSVAPYSYIYMVRSAGVVYDKTTNQCIAKRCVRAIIQCTNDYNLGHVNPTAIAKTVLFLGVPTIPVFAGLVFDVALTAAVVSTMNGWSAADFLLHTEHYPTHFTYPPDEMKFLGGLITLPGYGRKAFLLRYYDENH